MTKEELSKGEREIFLVEFQKAIDSAHYFDQIGWLITSFFLIFLSSIFGVFTIFFDKAQFIPRGIKLMVIAVALLFAIVVRNLFIQSQNNKIINYKLAQKVGKKLEMERYKVHKNIQPNKINLTLYNIIMFSIEAILIYLFALNF